MATKDGRATRELTKARVVEIAKILLDGASEKLDIEEFIRERETQADSLWFVGEGEKPLAYKSIRKYVGKAERLIAEDCQKDRKKLLTLHIQRRNRLYAVAVSQGDVRAALSVLDSQANLLGLVPEKKTIGTDGTYPPLSVLVQTLIQAEGTQIKVMQTTAEPAKLLEGTDHEPGSPTGIDTPLIRGEKMPG